MQIFVGRAFQMEGIASGKARQKPSQMFTELQGASVAGAEKRSERWWRARSGRTL